MKKNLILILIILVIAFFIGYTFCADGVKETENESRNGDQNIPTKTGVKAEKLLSTSTSWDGIKLSYPTDSAVISVVRYTIPPKRMLGVHYHSIINGGLLIKGDLTIVRESDRKDTTLHAGQAFVEMVNTWHHGENNGKDTVDLVMCYLGTKGSLFSDNHNMPAEYKNQVMPEGYSNEGIKAEKILETTTSWDEVKLPLFPTSDPVIELVRYTVPAHQKLAPHYHKVHNMGCLLNGELTVLSEDGKKRLVLHKGDALEEMIGTMHHDENNGSETVDLIMMYAGYPNYELSYSK